MKLSSTQRTVLSRVERMCRLGTGWISGLELDHNHSDRWPPKTIAALVRMGLLHRTDRGSVMPTKRGHDEARRLARG